MKASRNIQLLSWFSFFSAFKLYSAFAAIYFTSVTHSVALGISILSIVHIADTFFGIPTGMLSDKIGRKLTIIFGAISRLISLFIFASSDTFNLFVIGSLFEGLALAFFSGNNEALLYDTVVQIDHKNKYHQYLGKMRSLAYPSLMIASVLGGLIAPTSIRLIFWISLLPQTISVILTLFIIEPKKKYKSDKDDIHFINSAKVIYRNIKLRKLSLAEILTQGVEESVFQLQLLFYNTIWPLWAVGLTRSIMSLGKFISFHFSAKVINLLGATRVLFFGTMATRVIHFFSIIYPNPTSPALMSTTSIFWGSVEVSRNKLLHEEFTASQRATMYSFISFLGSLIAGIVGIAIGLASDKFGVRNTLLTLQLFFLPITYLYLSLHRTQTKRLTTVGSNTY